MELIFNVIGGLGVICLIGSYFLLQIGKFTRNSRAYWDINLLGAVLVIISLFWAWNLAQFILEMFWLYISICGHRRTAARAA